ncbi:preprotein translocase subunit SecY [Candidatus Bathyarchaeota archaeon]|nr:MAG: preprotein translocase subunit SecY [Candidatus Bathyarchaeota archaeon]
MAGRFLSLFKPISRFLPVISPPDRKVRFTEKIFWTALVLILYFIMGEIPLYGIRGGGWELSYMRVIFASRRGTLIELGIGPIVTAGLILQLLVGANMIECDMSDPEDRALFTSASKAFSIIFTGVQASAYIIGGVYGTLPPITAMIVFLQLIATGVVIILMDELIQKGWGIGSGVSLFILAGVAQQVFNQCFFPTGGIFPMIASRIINGESISDLFVTRGPSILGFITTVVTFFVIIYLEGVRVEIPISHAMYRGYRGRYPIKLLYVSNLPVIFASALFANIYFFSQLFSSYFPNNFWVGLLGSFDANRQPIGGLVYYVTSPGWLGGVVEDPLRAFGYTAILVIFCVIFSITWLEVGGLGPSTVAQQLVDSGMQIPGYRRSARPIEALLKRYIPPVAVLGGIIVGLVAAISDFLGVFGSGTGILLSVGIIYQYYQAIVQERAVDMYPALRRFFGK